MISSILRAQLLAGIERIGAFNVSVSSDSGRRVRGTKLGSVHHFIQTDTALLVAARRERRLQRSNVVVSFV